MKTLTIFAAALFCTAWLYAQDSIKLPKMTFEKTFIDLGEVRKGDKKTFYLNFTNTGQAPLNIEFISSCDCTEAEFDKDAVQPGEKGKIKVVFDSGGKDKDEVVGIDILLAQYHPVTEEPLIESVEYTYTLVE